MKHLILLTVLLAVAGCDAPWRGPPDYDSIFVQKQVVEWKIDVSDENWLKLITDPKSLPCHDSGLGPGCSGDTDCPLGCQCLDGTCAYNYVEADLEVDGVAFPRVGLQFMADVRRQKATMRIRFNLFDATQLFYGVKRVNLRSNADDPSFVREGLALDLMHRASVPTPRFSFALVSINGNSGGLYTLVQQVDRKFLEDRFGEDWGNLYLLEESGNLKYQGDDPDSYYPPFDSCYQLKTDEYRNDVSDLISLMQVLDRASDSELKQELQEVLDIDQTLRALAVNSWMANMDSYPGTGDNLYLYRDATNRFRYIPWGLHRAFGNYHGQSCTYTTDDLYELDPDAPTCLGPRPLVDRLLGVPEIRQLYHEHLRDLIDGVLHPEEVLERMEGMRELIRDLAYQDSLDEFTDEEFDAAFIKDIPEGDNPERVPGLEPFVRARDRRVREVLGGE
jgi:spore coat protein CotH